MKKLTTLNPQGNWYKGTTHAHTSVSDGRMSPRELTDLYKENGYSFVALTDHCVYGVHSELEDDRFIILPGVELDIIDAGVIPGGKTFCHHVVGLAIPGENTFKHGYRFEYDKIKTRVNDIIAMLVKGGNCCIYAHPSWSHVRHEEMDTIEGIIGMEIYNNTCQVSCYSGYADSYFDRLIYDGRKILCFASDDTHQGKKDYMGGFIWVKAKSLTHQDIFDAIMAGSFYASNGPRIEDFYIEDGKAAVSCSPCRSIAFLADNIFGAARNAEDTLMTAGEYTLNGKESYVRVVCEDEYGKKAWSQPIWIK